MQSGTPGINRSDPGRVLSAGSLASQRPVGPADPPVLEREDVDGTAERQERGQEPSPRASRCNTLVGR